MKFVAQRRLQHLLLSLLALAAAVSLYVGCRGALSSSRDLQWGAAHLLLQHIDPYAEFLAGNPHHQAHFSPPNYLPLLYVLILPLGALSFHAAAAAWCAITVALSVVAVALLRDIFQLSRRTAVCLLLLLWCSMPFRTTLQVGQMSMLELCFFCLIYRAAGARSGWPLGLSFAKYSFSPVAVSWFAFRARYGALLLSLVLPLAGLLLAWSFTSSSLLSFAIEPLKVSRTSVFPGQADLMTLTECALERCGVAAGAAGIAAYAVAFAAAFLFSFTLRRRTLSRPAEFSLIALASLFTFKHLRYDYVFLIVPLAYAWSRSQYALRKLMGAMILFFWFLIAPLPVLPRLTGSASWTLAWYLFLLSVSVYAVLLCFLVKGILRCKQSLSPGFTPLASYSPTTMGAVAIHAPSAPE